MGDKLIKCPRCGAENLSGSVYCSKCGEKLEKSSGSKMNRKKIASILVTVCIIIIVLGAIKFGGPWIEELIQSSPSPETSTETTVIETFIPYTDAPETDKDSDGVPDIADTCYNPDCTIIDHWGCPRNSDGDDLWDCYDECPYEAGERTNQGCPVESSADEYPGIIGWEGDIPIIDWRYADQYYGQEVIMEGTIVDTYNSGNACFLNFHTDWKRYFTVVIFQNKFYKFPANPELYYRGKKVHVRGVVQEYEGAPEIILEDPSQIEIIG